MSYILEIANANIDKFPDTFLDWLQNNLHIYNAFANEVFKVQAAGFKHYSARTIIEVLRHHSALTEIGSAWKINDHHAPYLARLFDLHYPHRAGLFEYRTTKNGR